MRTSRASLLPAARGALWLHSALNHVGESSTLLVQSAAEPKGGVLTVHDSFRNRMKSRVLGRFEQGLLYSSADVFVAPSIQEAFGKTLVESMACGTPVVCFDATGPKDIVDHRINGYKAKPFDAVDLANGISWVVAEESRLAELGREAVAKVEREFNILEIAQQYSTLYQDILSQ